MQRQLTPEEKRTEMLTAPVDRLILKLAGPSVLCMLVTAIYNMADTFFVSQIGTSASGAVGVIFSLMAIFQAFAFMIGQGSGNNMSRAIGGGDGETAKQYVSVCFCTELIVGAIFCLVGMIFIEPVVYLLGATTTIAPYAIDYCRWILIGTPFIMASFGLNTILRFQGFSSYGAVGIVIGGVLNIILDPIFIFTLGLKTAGAAIATSISQIISFIILIIMCQKKTGCISINLRNFKPTLSMYFQIIHTGLPSLCRQGIVSISTIIFNHLAHPYGDACIAAYSIVNKYTGLINSASIGVGQGFQPVCGQNYGAKKYRRVLDSFYFVVKMMFIILLVLAVISLVFARPIVTMFRKDDPAVIEMGTLFLQYQALTLPLMAVMHSTNMFSQTIGYGFRATLVACLKYGICLIPMLFLLPPFFGIKGLAAAQPVADVLSTAIAILVVSGILRELQKMSEKEG